MYFIKEHQFVNIDSNNSILINLITGEADLIENNIKDILADKKYTSIPGNILNLLIDRHYLFNNQSDKDLYELELNNHLQNLELVEPPNFLLIPTYDCNLSCTYCFEKGYDITKGSLPQISTSTIDKMFNTIKNICVNKESKFNIKYNSKDICITLMGGEPLLKGNKEFIEYIIKQVRKNGYSLNIVTNGVDLIDFADILKDDVVSSIQITIDGPKSIHDKRRLFKNGLGSFDLILNSIKLALDNNIKTFVRINVDSDNIDYLPELTIKLFDTVGESLNFIPYIYLIQHEGCMEYENVLNEVEAIKYFYNAKKKFPILNKLSDTYHGNHLIKCIFDENIFEPTTRMCASSKDQYILDYKGDIYKCWWGIGKDAYKIGSFSQEVNIDDQKNETWKNRTINTIEKCKECIYKYICGGGCVGRVLDQNIELTNGNCPDFENIFNYIVKERYENSN